MGRVILWIYILGSYTIALIMYSLIVNLPQEVMMIYNHIEDLKRNKNSYILQSSEEEYQELLAKWESTLERVEWTLEQMAIIGLRSFNSVYMVLFLTAPITLMPFIIYKIFEIKLK